MPIVSSVYTPDAHTQVEGGRYVTERHTDDAGTIHRFEYLSSPSWGAAEYTSTMQARAVWLDEQLAEQEFRDLLNEEG